MGSSVHCNYIGTSGLGGKENNKKLSQNVRETSKFVLPEFINFEFVIQCESEKQPEKNKSTIAAIMIVLSND